MKKLAHSEHARHGRPNRAPRRRRSAWPARAARRHVLWVGVLCCAIAGATAVGCRGAEGTRAAGSEQPATEPGVAPAGHAAEPHAAAPAPSGVTPIVAALARAGFVADPSVPFAEHPQLRAVHDGTVDGQLESHAWVLAHDEGYVQLVAVVFADVAQAEALQVTLASSELASARRDQVVLIAIPFEGTEALAAKVLAAALP